MRKDEWRKWILIIVLTLVCVWLGSLIWSLTTKAQVAVSQAKEAESAYHDLEARKATLEQNLAVASTSRGQEANIRTAFGVAKPGEEVIVVVPPVVSTSSPKRTWWQWMFGWL